MQLAIEKSDKSVENLTSNPTIKENSEMEKEILQKTEESETHIPIEPEEESDNANHSESMDRDQDEGEVSRSETTSEEVVEEENDSPEVDLPEGATLEPRNEEEMDLNIIENVGAIP